MVTLTLAQIYFLLHSRLVGDLNFPAISPTLAVGVRPGGRRQRRRPPPSACVNLESGSFRLGHLKRRPYYGGSWCCWCKGLESEGDSTLEAEILEFMKGSEKPEVFPTKQELVNAGRMDLVEAIEKKGGWLSLGWDLGNDKEETEAQEIEIAERNSDDKRVNAQGNGRFGARSHGDLVGEVAKDFQQRVESRQQSNSFNTGNRVGRYGVSSVPAHSSHSPSSSGRSLEKEDEQETGIEGILTRLEKQRNLSLGINLEKNRSVPSLNGSGGDDLHVETSVDADSADLERSSRLTLDRHNNGIFNNSAINFSQAKSLSEFDGPKSSLKPEMWRTWSIQRAGFSEGKFEAAEISFDDNQLHERKDLDVSNDELVAITESPANALDKYKDINQSDVRGRLQHLDLELSSALRLLRSKSVKVIPEKGREASNELRKLSDAWEFQENEIMTSHERLRSLRAKLAVLEGKMALAIIDARKIVEEKQARIDGARRALQLLRTTCIVWPNSASEVLLAGSFDGWTSQRKMEKSGTGIFSVCLKLYPGRYEIKFIVDGIWRTDPLRPIVHNNGHENNLLVIT